MSFKVGDAVQHSVWGTEDSLLGYVRESATGRSRVEWVSDGVTSTDWYPNSELIPASEAKVKTEASRQAETQTKFTLKDSGQREQFDTGSQRDTRAGKGRYDLLPPEGIRRLALVFERGARKYDARNWEKGQPLSRFLDSALRHTFKVLEGWKDEDHAAQAAWNLLAFITIAERIEAGKLPAELDDMGWTSAD